MYTTVQHTGDTYNVREREVRPSRPPQATTLTCVGAHRGTDLGDTLRIRAYTYMQYTQGTVLISTIYTSTV